MSATLKQKISSILGANRYEFQVVELSQGKESFREYLFEHLKKHSNEEHIELAYKLWFRKVRKHGINAVKKELGV